MFELAAHRAAASSASLTPATLLAAMHTIKGESLGGLTVTLDFTGSRPRNDPCLFALQGDDHGGWVLPYGSGEIC